MDEAPSATAPSESERPRRWLLIVWVVALGIVPAVMQTLGWPRYHLASSLLGESGGVLMLCVAITHAALLAFGRYVLLGMILGGIGRRSFASFALAIGSGVGAVAVFESADALLASHAPSFMAFMLAGIGLALGLAIGVPWGAGKGGRVLACLVIVLALITPLAAAGLYARAAIVKDGPDLSMPKVTSLEKRRLVKLLRDQRDSESATTELTTIALSWHDLRMFAAWGCEIIAPDAAATVTRSDNGGRVIVALPLPGNRFALSEFEIEVEGDDRSVQLHWHELKFGERTVSNALASLTTPVLLRLVRQDAVGRQVLIALRDLETKDEGVALTYNQVLLPDEYLGQMTGSLDDPALIESTKYYVDRIVGLADSLPTGDQRFASILTEVFADARARSMETSPATENRAAILALSVTLGLHDVARLIGPVLDESQRQRLNNAKKTTVQGRDDWVKHFTLSAGLSVLSSEGVSDAIGLLKEELDGRSTGSGFSFTDLAADRAGTRFGTVATRSEEDALRIQNTLADGFNSSILLPPIGDLPEGLHDAEFSRRFGEVDSPSYRQMIQKIESRLDALPALN